MNEPSNSTLLIAGELHRFLQRASLGDIYFAEGEKTPPPLAFLVRFPRISLTLRGCDQMEIEWEGKIQQIEPQRGEVVFVPANCWNRPTWGRPVKALHLLFGKRHLGVSLVEHSGKTAEPAKARKASVHRVIGGPMQEILSAMLDRPKAPVDRLLVEALLHCTLELLTEEPSPSTCKGRTTYERVCLFLEENSHKPLSRDSVAEDLALSPNHLSRLFRQEGKTSFIEHLTSIRIDRAKFLLRHNDQTLDAIASACGFSETAYFCRVFKSKTGLTPTQFRSQKAGR